MPNEGGLGGTTLSSRTLGGIMFSETDHAPRARMGAHVHPNACWCLVRRGGFRERSRAGAVEQLAGDVIFRPARDEHENLFRAEGARCFNVELHSRLLEGLPPRAASEVLRGRRVQEILARLHREVTGRDASPLVAEGLVYQALGEAFQRDASSRQPMWLEQVRAEIEDHFDRPLSISGLAAGAGVHPAHLSRAFHRRFGSPVLAYIRDVRVRAAGDLLRRSRLPLADVAAGSGFADQSHLTRVFKRATGFTPARYRRIGSQGPIVSAG